jgi:hypothetical protein
MDSETSYVSRRRGRPSKKTEEICDEIIDRMSLGEPLEAICRDNHMPDSSTVRDWENADEAFSRDIARARTRGFDCIAADTLRIADTPMTGVIEEYENVMVKKPTEDEPAKFELVLVKRRAEDMLQHRKLQIDTRLKLLAKWDPKRYGERVALDHTGRLTLEQLITGEGVKAE